MIIDYIFYIIAFIVIIVGSLTDIKTREVPDWINFALIFTGFGLRTIFSLVYSDWNILFEGLFGFAVFFALAAVLFFTGQWGGGDSKLLIGMGTIIGLEISNNMDGFLITRIILLIITALIFIPLNFVNIKRNSKEMLKSINFLIAISSFIFLVISATFLNFSSFMVLFVLNMIIVGGIYGILWSIGLIIKDYKKVTKKFLTYLSDKKVKLANRIIMLITGVCLIAFFLVKTNSQKLLFASLGILCFFTFYLWILIKSTEKISMEKKVPISKLTEGDWIVEEIVIDKKRIVGPSDLGITKKQITKLKRFEEKGKIKEILIKEGIPFVPSFFFAFIITYIKPMLFLSWLFIL